MRLDQCTHNSETIDKVHTKRRGPEKRDVETENKSVLFFFLLATNQKSSTRIAIEDTLQHIATHCNTLQHTATHCNTLQHIATHCNTLQHTATHCDTLQNIATHCNTRQHIATHTAKHTATHSNTHCNIFQHTATHCDTLQHIKTHCNTLHYAVDSSSVAEIQKINRNPLRDALQHTRNLLQHTL